MSASAPERPQSERNDRQQQSSTHQGEQGSSARRNCIGVPDSAEAGEAEAAVEEEAPAAEEDSPEAAEAKAALAARLAELEKEIETAVEAEDYERADELNTAADGLRAELDAL